MQKTELIIFDCDGVLVDSEFLACRIESKLLNDAGVQITAEEMSERYSGLTWKDILLDIEKTATVPLSAGLLEMSEKLLDLAMETELEMIEGADRAMERIKLPKCICSNSTTPRLNVALNRTGLKRLIEPHVYSAYEVGTKKGKPDPNVFLFGAKVFNANPANTIVIEDSVHGVHAARAAGMRVIGFTGGSHTYPGHADRLTDAGAETVINRHALLNDVIEAMGEWRDE
ncbi:MAG: HAD-IA family hydrolase [Rhizobiaceae bacterium]